MRDFHPSKDIQTGNWLPQFSNSYENRVKLSLKTLTIYLFERRGPLSLIFIGLTPFLNLQPEEFNLGMGIISQVCSPKGMA